MLIYESQGFLEVESEQIKQLCRSTITVSFGGDGVDKHELQAVLCDYQNDSERRCRAAFYSKGLKRALVFAVSDSGEKAAWKHGLELLAQFGFTLDDVNLRLSPAMLGVVLRDVPGLSSPEAARKQRQDEKQALEALQQLYDDDSESAEGKRALLKLNADKRLNDRTQKLRGALEGFFSPEESVDEEVDALLSQVKDLTARLEMAEQLAEDERSQREMSESITAAAEKRLQELEETLVQVETKSSGELKLKRKIVKLQGQVKTLNGELKASCGEMDGEREKQQQFVEDVKSAQERVSELEGQLEETQLSLDGLLLEIDEARAERDQAYMAMEDIELRLNFLNKELSNAKDKDSEQGELVDVAEAELAEVKGSLDEAQHNVERLEKDLSASLEEAQSLRQTLEQSDAVKETDTVARSEYDSLSKLRTNLSEELKTLRADYDHECSLRKRIERIAVEDDKRIADMEAQLENLSATASTGNATEASGEAANDIAELKLRLQVQEKRCNDAQQAQQSSERELDDAHKMIDSLERMLNETGVSGADASEGSAEQTARIEALEQSLSQLETELEQEQLEQKKLSKELAVTEQLLTQKTAEQVQAKFATVSQAAPVATAEVAAPTEAPTEAPTPAPAKKKALPHELRPAPKKGALFHPDWDLTGLPCKSSGQVIKVWETVYNVQISLEGYAAQYCMAFLVLLQCGKKKNLYLLYRLKQDKHTLVCVPAQPPKDEKALKNKVEEVMSFLRMSGFEMEELSKEHIDGALGSYFIG